ncbi:hypothetical protein RvY_16505 [Ramazzottius varieornatus]|uniref:Major facilitator superfamily (MFS) profile domain-containing protein n=1 Tax=Ramazzottius varieornatus TaxID=947166 RepID=A0A1D1W010_RAMVA|nr:hypothetical protein RvY_16505 [Ramazzottius varieornatus]
MDPLLLEKHLLAVPREYDSRRLGHRHGLLALTFLGMVFYYASRIALSISMVAMTVPLVRNTTFISSSTDVCPNPTATALNETGVESIINDSLPIQNVFSGYVESRKFNWDSETQGILHGSFFYGYLISQVPGGWIAHKFGAKKPFALCMLLTGILTLLSPLAVTTGGVWLFFAVRFTIGIFQGIIWPTVAALWSPWAPPLERGRLVSVSYSGTQLGTVFGMYVAGLLAHKFNWEAIFYCFGTLCIVWAVLWSFIAYDTPQQHPWISAEEREYITSSLSLYREKGLKLKTPRSVPWLKILTTLPLLVTFIVEFCYQYGFFTIVANLPTYLSNIHHFSLQSNGLISAMPYLVRWILTICSANLADWILVKKFCSRTTLRKSMSVFAFVTCGLCLVGVAYSGCNSTLAIALFTIGVGCSGAVFAGHVVAYSDMSVMYSSVLTGLGNGAGVISGIVAPYVVGVLTKGPNGQSIGNWQSVFLISAGLYALASVLYGGFATAKRQPWDKPTL